MGHLAVFLILLLSVSSATSTFVEKSFRECMFTRVDGYSKSTENIVFNSSSSQYPQVLESLEQNPRWLNSSTKPLLIIRPFHDSEIQAAVLYAAKSLGCRSESEVVGLVAMIMKGYLIFAGATLGELYYKISKASKVHGFPAGICPSVGVDVNGRILDRESMGEDVFWATRGGSATSFGVILAWKIRLVKVPPIVTGFNIHRTLEEGATKLVHRWQYIADKLHKDLFIRIVAQNSGGNSKTFQVSFASLFLGGKDKLIPIMNESFPELGLQAKDCTEMSWIQSVLYFAGYNKWDPLEVLLSRIITYKSSFKAKSDFVKEPIPEIGLEGVWKMLLKEQTLALVITEPFGGMNEISEAEIPFPHRKGNLYNIQYMVKWEVNGSIEASNRHLQWMQMLYFT
ncbi:FAD-binding, type 2, subdomain 1 [Sesbania bispinosa]|nr:FAD-binding, type 2, subdomain 1 [Sesbania bispinosa]